MKQKTTIPEITFKRLLRFIFGKKKYVQKKVWFSGRMRKVISETYNYVELEGIKTHVHKNMIAHYGKFNSETN